jgi:hypothetical protein
MATTRMLGRNHLEMMSAAPSEDDGTSTPEVYGFCDSQGVFHSFEGPEGQRMVMAMRALEEKIIARVENSLVEMRQDIQQNKSKSQADSEMLRNVVAEQDDLSSRMDALSKDAFESRVDLMAQIDEVSQESLESRLDLIIRTEEISQEAFEMRADCLASLDELEMKINASKDILSEVSAPALSEAELELPAHKAKISDLMAKLEDKVKVSDLLAGLRNAVATADEESAAKADEALKKVDEVPVKQQTACDLDLAAHAPSVTLKESKNLDAWLQGPGLHMAEMPYSGKTSLGGALPSFSFSSKSLKAAPTFNVQRPRPLAHMTSSQSMPFLAPLF